MSTKNIDLEIVTDIFRGNVEAAKKLINFFLHESLPKYQADIDQMFQERDSVKLTKILYKMYGALCYCGMPRLQEAVRAMELAAESEEWQNIDISYAKLKKEIDAVKACKDFDLV